MASGESQVAARHANERELRILDDNYINVNTVELHGGSILISGDSVVCRIPAGATLRDACECAVSMMTLSPDLFVVAPTIETDGDSGDVLVRLGLEDVPKLRQRLEE